MKYIYKILNDNKWSLVIIYFYMCIYQILFLIEPYVLGKSIDGLLNKSYFWIFCLLGVELLANVFMYKRMVYDTKVYTRIYNDIVFNYLQSEKDTNTSMKVARTDMAHSIIHFFEDHVPYYLMSIISIIGSLFFIFIQHPLTGYAIVFCIIPILIIVTVFYPKIAKATKVSNTHYETKVDTLESNDESRINTFFKRRRKMVIFNSTLQGKNWASLNIAKSLFLIISLIVFTHDNVGLTQGQAITMYAYINQFLVSLLSIPVGVHMFTQMKDIIWRLKTD